MYFSKIALVSLVAVASARPQISDYSNIVDEADPRFGFNSNPQYAFKYQVSDKNEQTFIAHDENRDGNAVTGQYSYVDPLGSLITVRYTADDVNGYTATREVQQNFITIKNKPKKEVPIIVAPRPAPPPRRPDNSDLVAKIIAQLTPFIKQTVTDSLGASRAPVAQVTSSSSLFGQDGENRITVDTPNYNFDKLLF